MSAYLTPIAAVTALAESWREEAARRRQLSKHDPVADALVYCADEAKVTLAPFTAPDAVLTVEQFAADQGVTPQAVRNWIHRGELPATKTPHGYRIARAARRARPTPQARSA